MKVLRIVDWDKTYENHKSRVVKDLKWVPTPNQHDTEGFNLVMMNPRGLEIYGAFKIIVEVASKCPTRGLLLKQDGKPITSKTLSIMTRGKDESFDLAIKFLSEKDGPYWLEWVEMDDTRRIEDTTSTHQGHLAAQRGHPEDTLTPDGVHVVSDKCEEGKGREENRRTTTEESVVVAAVECNIPSQAEVTAFGLQNGCSEALCKRFFEYYQGNNKWLNQYGRMIDWQMKLAKWRDDPKSASIQPNKTNVMDDIARKEGIIQRLNSQHPNGNKPQWVVDEIAKQEGLIAKLRSQI